MLPSLLIGMIRALLGYSMIDRAVRWAGFVGSGRPEPHWAGFDTKVPSPSLTGGNVPNISELTYHGNYSLRFCAGRILEQYFLLLER